VVFSTFTEAFNHYGEDTVRAQQEKGRPFWQISMNRIKELRPIREFREGRGTHIAKDLRPLFEIIMKSGPIDTLLDSGCGQMEVTRFFVDYLKEFYPKIMVIGIDNSMYVAGYKLDKNLVFCLGDALHTDIPDKSVKVHIAGFLLQALNFSNRNDFFDELDRTMAPDGFAIFIEVLHKESMIANFINAIKHVFLNLFSPYLVKTDEGWKKMLQDHDLEILGSVETEKRCRAYLTKRMSSAK